MKDKVKHYKHNWRDVLLILTAVFVLASLVLVAYGNRQNNKIISRVDDHIDCILKVSAAVPPPGTPASSRKYLVNSLSNNCHVRFTQ